MENCSLFLFGECAEAAFLSHFPVSLQPCSPYTLSGYALRYAENGRSYLVPSSGEQVSGLLCDAQNTLLWAMDQWKGIPLLRRTAAQTACGEVYIYENNAAAVCEPPELPLVSFGLTRLSIWVYRYKSRLSVTFILFALT